MKLPTLVENLVISSVCTPFWFVLSNNVLDPVGNHIASYFPHCHLHIVDFSAQPPFNFQTSNMPRTFYTYPGTSLRDYNIFTNVSSGYNLHKMRILDVIQKIQSFKCILNMISVVQKTSDVKYVSSISVNVILTPNNVISRNS